MSDREPELEFALPRTPTPPPPPLRVAGLSLGQIAAAVLAIAALVWAIWVTHAIVEPAKRQDIVAVRLSAIVGEYVQAQARSASPPARVEAEMQRFMATLEERVQERGAKGQIVLVGEAVLTRNVPDVTDDIRRAVYATGIRLPERGAEPEAAPLAPSPGSASSFDGSLPPEAGRPADASTAN
ncbi:MAG: TrbI F-type domain-containing protein [Sphingopyxis sp.]|uniref:TrbI F-type domain-containing protein n=1 Tax=Sphingopyxis sp. TaxID=1908224 RepID=UPI001A2B2333|nr:TrbI F-type domain-containing protein [Sphingopyxis sp.]MBJ7499649.1 TrbI F-type domain-containing protein [Sphingopyxis sp.]